MILYRYAVAYVIHNGEGRILIVKRPDNDVDLPGMWGLPAGSVEDDETEHHAVIRSGRQKLGVELKIGRSLGSEEAQKEDSVFKLSEFEAKIVKGEPKVPQPPQGMTQYSECKWGTALDLYEAARAGSLCSRIYLKHVGQKWD